MANSETRVDLLNRAQNLSQTVVIFQKNRAPGAGDTLVAWRAVDLKPGASYSFSYSPELAVEAEDTSGNGTAQVPAEQGKAYEVIAAGSGHLLQAAATPAASAGAIEVRNLLLGNGSISVNIYKDGFLLALQSGIAPGDSASFLFTDDIYLGVASQATPGQVLGSGAVSSIAEIGLRGLKSAEITITGSGAGVQFVLSHSAPS